MRLFFVVSALFAMLVSIVLFNTNYANWAPGLLIGGVAALAILVKRMKLLSGFSFSLWILAGVIASLSYPNYFLSIGSFKTEGLIVPLLQIIMFGMGSQMSLNDFAGVVKMPKGVIIGVVCQFTIMPIIGFLIAYTFGFPPEIAAGIILVGSSPSGLASNVMSFIAKANLALSVTLTAFATLLSPIMTPLLMKLFASEMVSIDVLDMMSGIFNMVILPICAGLLFNLFAFGSKKVKVKLIQIGAYLLIVAIKSVLNTWGGSETFYTIFLKDSIMFVAAPILLALVFKYIIKKDKDFINRILSFVSMFGIAIIIVVITAAGRDSLLDVGFLLIGACLLHNVLGYSLGYSVGKLLRLKEQDCRTIALEVGMQNGGLASGLALQMGKVATVGLAPAVFGPLMNITGSSLASWWKGKRVND